MLDRTLLDVVYNHQEGIPWRAALSAADEPLLSVCALEP